jgi:hypothetical protein
MNEIHETLWSVPSSYCLVLPIPTDHSPSCKPSPHVHKLSLQCYPLNSPFPQLPRTRKVSVVFRNLKPVTFWLHSVDVSHELGLSCGYDIISSGLFYHIPYDES